MSIPTIDAHFHIYDPLTVPRFRENGTKFYVEDLEKMAEGINLVGAVHLQTSASADHQLYETVRCEQQAARSPGGLPNALVVYANLDEGAEFAEQIIQTHLELSSKVRGVRQSSSYRSKFAAPGDNPNILSDPKFLDAFPLLEKYNLSFDAWCYAYQIREVTALAKKFPNTRIVMDHFGGPYGVDDSTADEARSLEIQTISPHEAEQEFKSWKIDLEELSQQPNVFVKLSGATMLFMLPIREYYDKRKNSVQDLADAILPYIEHAIDCFGVDRCIWASNFPPDGEGGITYQMNWEGYKECFDRLELTQEEQRSIFFDNAVEFYRLNFGKKKCSNPQCSKLEQIGEDHFPRCGGCEAVCYCSKHCQAHHWKAAHRDECKKHDLSVNDKK